MKRRKCRCSRMLYDEFCARFPYEETEDQLGAIDATLKDLESGRPMDRLICGDVGFGKTEVALRAAFAPRSTASRSPWWCRPRCWRASTAKTFTERFAAAGQGRAASRLVGAPRNMRRSRRGSPKARRYRGRHPRVLGKSSSSRISASSSSTRSSISASSHKERLKELRAEVHVLTLSRDADPAHAATGADGRARSLDHRDAAGRSAGGAHLRVAVRSADDPRGAAARALSRRPGVLCGARASRTSPASRISSTRTCRR
jgi:hypothetical protein